MIGFNILRTPGGRQPMREYHYLARVDDIPARQSRRFEIGGKEILLCHVKGEFFALDNICTHAYAQLNEGRLRGYRLICPLHGASFDVRDGSVKGKPAFVPLRSYSLKIEDGEISVRLE